MNSAHTIDLKLLFSRQQDTIYSALNLSEVLKHPLDSGDNSECTWIKLLETYLPKRYAVSKATVIDCTGKTSDQLDVVIYDRQYSYLVFEMNGITYIPAESVYAAFEVKPCLSKEYIAYAGEKALSLRRLHRTSIEIQSAGGTLPPKKLHHIFFGILTKYSTWKDPLGTTFLECLGSQTGDRALDGGCSLKDGSFFVNGARVVISQKENTLIYFLIRLVQVLQGMGTVPAIDLQKYLMKVEVSSLDFNINNAVFE